MSLCQHQNVVMLSAQLYSKYMIFMTQCFLLNKSDVM